jgi:hypothetical protein
MSVFLTGAHFFVDLSNKDLKAKNYFKSWVDTLPARALFLLDVITKIFLSIPFDFIKTLIYSIEAFYTWGDSRKNFDDAKLSLYESSNAIMSSLTGIVATSHGKTLYTNKNNNLMSIINMIKKASGAIFSLISILQTGNLDVYWDPTNGFSTGMSLDILNKSKTPKTHL